MDYLILPHQLFDPKRFFQKGDSVTLYEHPWYFKEFPYHKKKLVFHRATMHHYQEELKKAGIATKYVTYDQKPTIKKGTKAFDPIDHAVRDELKKKKIELLDSPLFLTKLDEIEDLLGGEKHLSMASFYIKQRKRFDVLLQGGKPEGGKWSYDVENRKKIPKGTRLPSAYVPKESVDLKKFKKEIEKAFPKNPGDLDDFSFAIDREGAKKAMHRFFDEMFTFFGPYQDAILQDDPFTIHSVLSPYINVGLLTVDEVLEMAIHHRAPLPSKEGFIRQILGWREFMRAAYELHGDKMRKMNFFHHKKSLPEGFWDGETGIVPVDDSVKKALKFAYCHHIERLMVLGNYLLLKECDPNKVYDWFMSLFIDAYDWVMVPNVYGMSQYADGGMMTTKPYCSGSNYLKKMGNFSSGPWCEEFDALFWDFIRKNRTFFSKNPRMSMMVHLLDKR
jgi:deoxyribodipyrimidine photolyase-related protein